MHHKTRLLLAAALALIALSTAATAANAASFSITPGGAITSISLGLITFSSAAAGIFICGLTLKGRLNTGLWAKTAGTEFGRITEGTTNACEELLLSPEDPWRLNYTAILGTLPDDVANVLVTIVKMQFGLRGNGVECLYEPELRVLLETSFTGPALYTSGLIRVVAGQRIAKHSGSIFCSAGEMQGSLELGPRQTLKRL